jgi:hypothetical protein
MIYEKERRYIIPFDDVPSPRAVMPEFSGGGDRFSGGRGHRRGQAVSQLQAMPWVCALLGRMQAGGH